MFIDKENLCMKKIKEKTKKYLGRIGKAGLVITSFFLCNKHLFWSCARQQDSNRYTKFNH